MKRGLLLVLLSVTLTVLLAACGSSGGAPAAPAAGAGNIEAGKALFAQTVIGSQPGCVTCHSLNAGEILVGPSMAGIAARAGSAVAGQSAEQYLRTSILEPDSHLSEGFAEGIMQSYKDVLSETQLNDLVAYLQTLK
jgi:mono/diheme cytochrome c family protein